MTTNPQLTPRLPQLSSNQGSTLVEKDFSFWCRKPSVITVQIPIDTFAITMFSSFLNTQLWLWIITTQLALQIQSANFGDTDLDDDLAFFRALPGHADLPACAEHCLVWGYYIWNVVGCHTSTCVCQHFAPVDDAVSSCVPSACKSSQDLPPAASLLSRYCSTVMGVGWVAPSLTTQRTFSSSITGASRITTQTATTTLETRLTITPSGILLPFIIHLYFV